MTFIDFQQISFLMLMLLSVSYDKNAGWESKVIIFLNRWKMMFPMRFCSRFAGYF